ncbi:geraniol dehydrogenase [Nocardia sp. 852002-20019_SCH5090214]|uniref:NAD(P)-dependent alcohol dehydrogenase n=1 Tax=Nocardia nova TaxID=37330 RepID=A0A2S5ZZ52_9NOCA|nr:MULTISPECIES: NAD(P)-dependent alcohol dehydrogenase [Nocardia]MBV7707105.1 NAD(P)-dependent alcohol dehydrogenase [Nocardia nova]OBA58342.1 geraniol dehydrogenase [Nocardia sp. 852002-20019_SCH5090214]PPI91277.1 NAD(P)-dependent alcohol dehydrogenase [Nocardia nova]PPJ23814.1 NAD(P)-dependent alcohol dehydrogenase [Nocardia nova]
MQALAAVARAPHSDFSLETITIDGPKPGEVLVKIEAVGICHTDLAARDGALPVALPAVFGHEGCGVVEAIGEGVTKVAPGDRVAITFASCGSCPACRADSPSYCHNFMHLNYAGVRADGTGPLSAGAEAITGLFFGQSSFATHSVALERNVVKAPSDLPAEIIAPIGCGIQTGAGAVLRSLTCRPGSSLLVAGAGSVGLAAVMAAAVRECATIIVIEPHASRRELAIELGATHAIDPGAGPVAEQVRAIVAAGVDYAIDTSGMPAVIDGLVKSMTFHGKLGLIGVPADPEAALPISVIETLVLGLTVVGIIEGDSVPDEFIPELIELYRAGRFPIDKLVTTFDFTKINDAVAAQHRGEVLKPVLVHD